MVRSLLLFVTFVAFAAAEARAQEGPPPAPELRAQGRYRPYLDMDETRCVTKDDQERAARAANPQAFSSDVGIYLPPLYWASKDRTFEQIALMYWKNVDVEDATRFDLLFPLFARLCTPENDTTVAPFGLAGWKTDALGTAGYVGPYFFRRDAEAETDTLFPVFWWIRDDDGSTLIAGPWFDIATDAWNVRGLAPLYFAFEGRDRFFELLLPLYFRVGDDDSESGLALQTFWSRGPREWSVLSVPFYAGGEDEDTRRSWHIVPPLLFGAWTNADESGFVAGPYVNLDSPRSHDRAFVPVFAFGEGTDPSKSPLAAFLLDDSFFAPDGSPGARDVDAPFHYHLVPPLLYAHAGDGTFERTWFIQSYLQRSSAGWDAGSLPFYLGGRSVDDDGLSYDVVPLLLFARRSERGEHDVWFAQTWATWRGNVDDWSVASVPFVWAGGEVDGGRRRHHLVIPPLAFASWGGPTHDMHGVSLEESLLVGPWLDVDRQIVDESAPGGVRGGGHDSAIFPLGVSGRVDEGGEAAWLSRPLRPALNALLGRDLGDRGAMTHWLVPPLLAWHVADEATGVQRTWVLQSYLATSPAGWDVGVLPFYIGGKETQDPERGLSYDVVPPLLLAHWSEGDEHSVWFAQTFAQWSKRGWWFASLPLAAGGGNDDGHFALAPPLLFLDVGFDDVRATHFATAWLWTWENTWHAGFFPFYAGGRSENGAYDLAPLVLFARWANAKDENVLWVAQTVASWDPQRWSVASFPFFFGATEPDGRHHLVVPPLLYAQWGNGVDEENLVAGLWLDLQRPGGREQWVAPFFMEGHAHLADWRADADASTWGTGLTRVLRPTLQSVLGKAVNSTEPLHFRMVPPLLYAHVGDGAVERTWFLQSYFARSPTGWDAGSLPFYVGGRFDGRFDGNGSDESAYAYDVIPPLLFARFADEEAWWFAQVPFVLGGGDVTGAHALVIPPLLLAFFGNSVDETIVAGPWIDVDAPGGHDTALLPLYFGGEAHAPAGARLPEREWGAWISRALRPTLQAALGRPLSSTEPMHHRFVPPLLYGHVGGETASGDTERTWFLQSYFARSDAGWDLGIAPLYFGGRETQVADGLSYDVVPPLLFALWGDEGERSLWAAQTFAHWNAEAWWLASVPFAFAGGNDVDGTHHLVIPPLLLAQWGNSVHENLWAAQTFASWDENDWWLASVPFVFAGGDDVRGTHHLVIPPLLTAQWGDGTSENLLVAQTLAHWDDARWWLASFPFVFAGATPARGSHHLVMPPLLTAHWGDDVDERTVIGPWFDVSGPRGAHRGVVPFYFGGRENGSQPFEYDLVPPLLFGRGSRAEGNWLWFAQTWATWNETEYAVSSVPLLFAGDDGYGDKHLIIPPLLFASWGSEHHGADNLVVGPYVSLESPKGVDRALLPVYFEGQTTQFSGGPIAEFVGLEALHGPLDSTAPAHYRVIPFLYAHMGNGVTEQTLFLQSWLRRSPHGVDAGSFPFWWGGWTTRDNGPSYQVVPPLLFATWSDGQGTRDIIAGPVWHTERPHDWSTWALPFYLGADGDRERRPWYHVVPPLLFATWGDSFRETSTTVQLPFYLRHDDRKGFIDAKTPLWVTWGNDRDWRSLVLAPVPVYASYVDGEDWLLAPLVYRRDNKVTSDLVVFPFLWDFKGPELDATVISGLWWDFHWRADRERLQIAPGYLRWDDPTETLTIAGPVAWSSSKDSAATSFHVFPLYSQWSFHPQHVKWRVMFGALGYERERDVEQWMIFWVKTKPE